MSSLTVQEIEQAIHCLSPQQREELFARLDQPHAIDARLSSDTASGLLDRAIAEALDDEANARTRPL